MKIKWKCTKCDDIIISDSKQPHTMDFCKCGETGFDLEEGYSRGCGLGYELIERMDDRKHV